MKRKENYMKFLEFINNFQYGGDGVGKNTAINGVDKYQLIVGIAVELEHTKDLNIAASIAIDHLSENRKYYIILIKSGLVDEEKAINLANKFLDISKLNVKDDPDASVQVGAPSVEEPVDEIKTGEYDEELTDELLGFKPHNVGEDYDYAAAERDYEDREDMRNHPEDYEGDTQHPLSDVLDSDGTEEDLSKQNVGEKGINMSEIQDREEMEYPGEIGDRYEDAENNNYTVKDKGVGDGEVTLQGHEGEQEITTQDLQYLKKLGESRERIELAKNVMRKKVITEGMSKKEAALILVNHYIK